MILKPRTVSSCCTFLTLHFMEIPPSAPPECVCACYLLKLAAYGVACDAQSSQACCTMVSQTHFPVSDLFEGGHSGRCVSWCSRRWLS